MKTLSVAKLKAQFSSVVDDLKQGKEVEVTYGRNKVPLATIVPQSKMPTPDYSIELGTLQKQGRELDMKNFEMTDEEFLSS